MKKVKQNLSWSEEDEQITLSIEQVMNCASLLNLVPEKIDKIRTWLKHLKDRVHPQSKQDWTEDDEERVKNIISVLGVQVCWNGATGKKENPYQKEIDWLESLKYQNTWKPSNEQIVALEHFVRSIWESEFASPYNNNIKLVYLLLNQLKKLK